MNNDIAHARTPVAVIITAILAFAFSTGALASDIPPGEHETWTGQIHLSDSVNVWGFLTIEEGTEVIIDPGSDIIIKVYAGGGLTLDGSKENPVLMHSGDPSPGIRDWKGIQVFDDKPWDTEFAAFCITNAVIQNAEFGLQGIWSIGSIRDSQFEDCGTGVRFIGEESLSFRMSLKNSTASRCGTGFELLFNLNARECRALCCDLGFDLQGDDPLNQAFVNCLAASCTQGIHTLSYGGFVRIIGAVVEFNSDSGIEVGGPTYLIDSLITDNGGNGLWSTGSGQAFVRGCDISRNFNNVVSESHTGQIVLGQEGGIWGNNKITDPIRYHVINRRRDTLYAENCYFGAIQGSLPVLHIIGDVDIVPFLTESPW